MHEPDRRRSPPLLLGQLLLICGALSLTTVDGAPPPPWALFPPIIRQEQNGPLGCESQKYEPTDASWMRCRPGEPTNVAVGPGSTEEPSAVLKWNPPEVYKECLQGFIVKVAHRESVGIYPYITCYLLPKNQTNLTMTGIFKRGGFYDVSIASVPFYRSESKAEFLEVNEKICGDRSNCSWIPKPTPKPTPSPVPHKAVNITVELASSHVFVAFFIESVDNKSSLPSSVTVRILYKDTYGFRKHKHKIVNIPPSASRKYPVSVAIVLDSMDHLSHFSYQLLSKSNGDNRILTAWTNFASRKPTTDQRTDDATSMSMTPDLKLTTHAAPTSSFPSYSQSAYTGSTVGENGAGSSGKFTISFIAGAAVVLLVLVVINLIVLKRCSNERKKRNDSVAETEVPLSRLSSFQGIYNQSKELDAQAYVDKSAQSLQKPVKDSLPSPEDPIEDPIEDLWDKMKDEHPKAFFLYHVLPDIDGCFARQLVYCLRKVGVNCTSHEFETVKMARGVTEWLLKQLEEADAILLLCNATLSTAWRKGESSDNKSSDVAQCNDLIRQAANILNGWDCCERNALIIPVILKEEDKKYIPDVYKGKTRIQLPCDSDWMKLHRLIMKAEHYDLNGTGKLKVPKEDGTEKEKDEYERKMKERAPTLQFESR